MWVIGERTAHRLLGLPAHRVSGAAYSVEMRDPAFVSSPARFSVPAGADPTFARERLCAVIGLTSVTAVAAPAGSGKSTILAGWSTQQQMPVAWNRLDPRVDDPAAFWSSMLESLQCAGVRNIADLQAPTRDAADSFASALATQVRGTPIAIVLDDAHHLHDADTLRSLTRFGQELPEQVQLLLVGRTVPDIGLHRLRMEGRLTELGPSDLNLTVAETAEFLTQQGVAASRADAEALHQRTEGWVAGVRLAVLAIQAGREPSEMIAEVGGDDQAIGDYLAAEVMDHVPPSVREFLEMTGVCTHLSADLCNSLTERTDSADVLEYLADGNLFTIRLDRHRRQYRYHDLLREHLEAELRRRNPQRFREQHRRAGLWWLATGDTATAMEHFAQAEDVPVLVALAREHGIGRILDGQAHRLSAVLQQVDPQQPGAEYL